ncbi:MAG TPA: aldo/keto reductase, partial [Rubellimicrobium sp.]|nr:aldo/keto reductase [Rubellimicrobium sp.]
VVPAVNQVELHPRYQQRDLRDWHTAHGIVTESYSPLGGEGAAVLREPVVTEIAARLGRTPAQVVIRWHLQQDLIVLPKTADPARAAENVDVWDFTLSPEDMTRIDALDRPDGKTLPQPEEMNELF